MLDLDAVRERNERRKSYRPLTSPCPEADGYNDDVDALCEEVGLLREALKPFAAVFDCESKSDNRGVFVLYGHCRRAHAALNPPPSA